MRQSKEMLHLGTPANVQDVLVQDHVNYLPVRALQMQQMVLNAARCAPFTATIVPRKKRFLMTNAMTMMFMMMMRKPEEED